MTSRNKTGVGPQPASLTDLGWREHFAEQLDADSDEIPARVIAVHRQHVIVHDGEQELSVFLGRHWYRMSSMQRPTVGDWVLLDASRERVRALLERASLLTRMGAGSDAGQEAEEQPIAANVDSIFIVTSCNDEFNESRLERYLTLARNTAIPALVIITKSDLTEQADAYRERTLSVSPDIPVQVVNALDEEDLAQVRDWLIPHHTIAMLGSSGVGKSTLLNTLAGHAIQLTQGIREDDASGRHTTTHRSLHLLPAGALILDSPGMRELGIAKVHESLNEMFEDIEALKLQCKFTDCAHQTEPGCAIVQALADGTLEQRRLDSYQKLHREEARNTKTLGEQRREKRRQAKRFRSLKEKDPDPEWPKNPRP